MATLLERDAERTRLIAWLRDAEHGRGRVVFIGGEAGIGKTALVASVAAAGGSGRVAVGRWTPSRRHARSAHSSRRRPRSG